MEITGLKRDYRLKTGQKNPVQGSLEQRDIIIKKMDNPVLNGTCSHPTQWN